MSDTPTVTSAGPGANGLGEFLEFEKPLQRIMHDIEELEREQRNGSRNHTADIRKQRQRFTVTMKRLYQNLTPWETVLVARHPKRPHSTDYLQTVFRDFSELHGDRVFGDDKAITTGFARIGRHKVMFIGHNKGKDVKERIACNFGCAHPEGYRKALRKMKLAEKYGLPVVCLIDTQGAYPGIGSEERGIAQAIATNLMEMSRLRTPIVCVIIGEGGSGGALGLGVGDRIAMFQHSFYSVISPEGCAAILWKSADQRRDAADALKLTARELKKLDIIDEILPESVGGAHRAPEEAMASLEKYVVRSLSELKRLSPTTLLERRYERIRALGSFFHEPAALKAATAAQPAEVKTARRSAPRSNRISKRLAAPAKVSA